MALSRCLILTGALYLLIGLAMGSYMGASGDHTLAPVHAHINLIGFVLSVVFGLIYRAVPALTESPLAKGHVWLHQIGAALLSLALFLMIGGFAPEERIGPLMLVPELALILGTLAFTLNLFRTKW